MTGQPPQGLPPRKISIKRADKSKVKSPTKKDTSDADAYKDLLKPEERVEESLRFDQSKMQNL
jgi:hypothetical protein